MGHCQLNTDKIAPDTNAQTHFKGPVLITLIFIYLFVFFLSQTSVQQPLIIMYRNRKQHI